MKIHTVKTSDGVEMSVRLFGSSQKDALLICHGLGADSRQWIQDAEYFAKNRFVIVPDLRGQGLSGCPPEPSVENFTLRDMAGDVADMLNDLGVEKCDFVGNSLGGLVGLELVDLVPEKMRSLLTCGTTYELHFPKIIVWVRWFITKVLTDKAMSNLIAKGATKHEHARPLIKEMYSAPNHKVNHWINKNIYDYTYLDVARNFKGRLCLIKGEHDKEINQQLASTEVLFAELPNAQVVALPNAGHFTNLDQPEKFRTLVKQFLSGNE